MPIFEARSECLVAVPQTTFKDHNMQERALQRLLKDNISALGDGLMVLAEEFGSWSGSQRRIDLLCLDSDANLVVVELKRTQDGGHMDLQALRYAAMVSRMTFAEAVATLAQGRDANQPDEGRAEADILDFLQWSVPNQTTFARSTRIILAVADFALEVTTTVMWLRASGIDIRCVRLRPYAQPQGPLLLDIQQTIPPPEAAEFQIQLDVKRSAERKEMAEGKSLRLQFWEQLLALANTKTPLHAGRTAADLGYMWAAVGRAGFMLNYVTRAFDSRVELYIADDKLGFDALFAKHDVIDDAFGVPLKWDRLPKAAASRISWATDGGYRSPPETWPATHERLVDGMLRLDRAVRAPVQALP